MRREVERAGGGRLAQDKEQVTSTALNLIEQLRVTQEQIGNEILEYFRP